MSMFHVGQRVVCITQVSPRALSVYGPLGITYPAKGCIYTIREIGPLVMDLLLLEEIRNPIIPRTTYESGFHWRNFSPVKDTSIEVFRALLSPIHERENA